jgi:uncharacterized protein (DUF427 family)
MTKEAPREKPAARGSIRIEQSAKRVRAYLGGHVVALTTRPILVWERPYYPTHYFPVDDVRTTMVAPSGEMHHSPSRGDATLFTVKALGGREAANAAARYESSPIAELRELIRFDWDAMDEWYGEDEPVYVHPRDPYTRIDILASSRDVRFEIAGVTVADSPRPRLLFETGLPARYYLPRTDVRMDLLQHTDTITRCPYKGQPEHFAAHIRGEVYRDVAWSYPTPLPESQKIAGLIAFYDERVDTVVDDVKQDRPKTHFAWADASRVATRRGPRPHAVNWTAHAAPSGPTRRRCGGSPAGRSARVGSSAGELALAGPRSRRRSRTPHGS